jgi:hypothetical protein
MLLGMLPLSWLLLRSNHLIVGTKSSPNTRQQSTVVSTDTGIAQRTHSISPEQSLKRPWPLSTSHSSSVQAEHSGRSELSERSDRTQQRTMSTDDSAVRLSMLLGMLPLSWLPLR